MNFLNLRCGIIAASLLLLSSFASAQKPGLSLLFTGDIMLDRAVRYQIEEMGVEPLFQHVDTLLAGSDFVIANLECPATTIHHPQDKIFTFRAEPEWLRGLRAVHITHLNIANNHAIDQGTAGLKATVDSIIADGMVPLGCGIKGKSECDPTIIEGGGSRVAVFCTVRISLESWKPKENKYAPCQATVEELSSRVKEYKDAHPNELIVVCLHWGVELRLAPEEEQRIEARQLIDSGADAVIGHHPHVFQTAEEYKGKPIVYSLGNFVFGQPTHLPMMRGAVARLSINAGKIDLVELYPIVMKNGLPCPANKKEGKLLTNGMSKHPKIITARYRR